MQGFHSSEQCSFTDMRQLGSTQEAFVFVIHFFCRPQLLESSSAQIFHTSNTFWIFLTVSTIRLGSHCAFIIRKSSKLIRYQFLVCLNWQRNVASFLNGSILYLSHKLTWSFFISTASTWQKLVRGNTLTAIESHCRARIVCLQAGKRRVAPCSIPISLVRM